MSKTKEDIVGTRIGIYDVIYECGFKSKCNHKMYHVRCSECGWESDMHRSDIGRAKKCTHIRQLTKEQLDKWYEHNKKQCLHCGNDIPLGNLGFNEYKERKFCNSSCASSYNNTNRYNDETTIDEQTKEVKQIHKRTKNLCLNCGKELNKTSKKYCSSECHKDYEYKEYIRKWKIGEEDGMCGEYGISKRIRRYLREKYNNKCSRCGWSEINPYTNNVPLEAHHKDGDYTNNDEDNLDLLCPNCHSLTETYKAANKGQGRKDRKKYYLN